MEAANKHKNVDSQWELQTNDQSTFGEQPIQAGSSASSDSQNLHCSKDDGRRNDRNRISFLTQCKLELSAEVIRWKEESFKLRKENEELSRKNIELETNLCISLQENKNMERQTLATDEESSILHKKLAKTFTKYHSYPWSELLNKSHSKPVGCFSEKTPPTLSESCEEVSKQLIERMKQEMTELQELGRKLAVGEKSFEPEEAGRTVTQMEENLQDTTTREVVENISNLKHETESLKQHLLAQTQKLHFIFNQISQNVCNIEDKKNACFTNSLNSTDLIPKKRNQSCSLSDWIVCDEKKKFNRPSDESFRAYFTQQLTNSKNTEEIKKIMQIYLDSENVTQTDHSKLERRNISQNQYYISQPSSEARSQQTDYRSEVKTGISFPYLEKKNDQAAFLELKDRPSELMLEEERVCPICEAVFPKIVPEKEFEAHVVAHLEAESASLLDQYEIV